MNARVVENIYSNKCVYRATTGQLEAHLKIILLCEHINDFNLSWFLSAISHYCDGIIVIDNVFDEKKTLDFLKFPKLLIYLKNCEPEYNKKLLWQAAMDVESEWVLFMRSNEIVDKRFQNLAYFVNECTVNAVTINYLITEDSKRYYDLPDSDQGILQKTNIYRKNKSSWIDIQDSNSELNKSSVISDILIYSMINPTERTDYGINVFTKTFGLYGICNFNNRFYNFEEISDSELQSLIIKKLDELTEYYLFKEDFLSNLGLYTGNSGIALLFALKYLWSNDHRYLEKMNDYLEEIISTIQPNAEILSSFCGGVSGFGWLICYLSDKKLIDIDEDYFKELDEILRGHLRLANDNKAFDQMHGMLSIALYFLKRNLKDDLKYVLNVLGENMEYDNNEVRWLTSNLLTPPNYNFGLAHGVAGVLYFLGKCFHLNVECDLCRKIGDGIIQFYNNNEQSLIESKSYYPYYIYKSNYQKELSLSVKSRLSWCYGDLSVLMTVYNYAVWTDNVDLRKTTVDKLINSTQRKNWRDVCAFDAQFCHGAAGIAHMYNRMYHNTGCSEFKNATIYWMKAAIEMGKSERADSVAGYLFLTDKKEITWEGCEQLLEGACGVGLSFLSVLDDNLIDWDECMMLS